VNKKKMKKKSFHAWLEIYIGAMKVEIKYKKFTII